MRKGLLNLIHNSGGCNYDQYIEIQGELSPSQNR